MTSDPTEREGTSQAGRALAALDPAHVAVDERTLEDLLRYVHEYTAGLVYHGPDDLPSGDLRALLGGLSPAEIGTFVRAPERFDPVAHPQLFRPHFVLLLVFLKLLEQVRAQLNGLTARHLEFYYREVLRMARRRPFADRVDVSFELAKGAREVMVPAGTRLAAGVDSLGKDRIYTTDRDLVVNRAQVAAVRAVFVDRRVLGFKEARAEARARAWTDVETGLWMLRIALGTPRGGDPLPPYPDGTAVTAGKLAQLGVLARSAETVLSLPAMRELIRRRDIVGTLTGQARADAWAAIVALLEAAGQRRRDDPNYRLPDDVDRASFTACADAALGPGFEDTWAKLRQIEDYFFVDVEGFRRILQQIEDPVPAGWDAVDALLAGAHRAKVRAARRRRLREIDDVGLAAAPRVVRLVREVLADPDAGLDDLTPFCPDLRGLKDAAQRGEWEHVHAILEVALRNRIGESAPQHEEWLNIYPAADAPAAGARASRPGRDESPRWATFGLRPELSPDAAPAPVLGWGVSSPILALREGRRVLTLALDLRADHDDLTALTQRLESSPGPLRVDLSTAEGWISREPELSLETLPEGQNGDLRVRLTLRVACEASDPPLAAPPARLADVESLWPALRVMLRPVWSEDLGCFRVAYRELGGLVVAAARLDVNVKGLQELALQGDGGDLNPRRPFEPFGGRPAVGSRLRIGHPELVDRPLDTLSFHVQWMDPPSDLAAHYAHYDLGGRPFTAKITVVDFGRSTELAGDAGLFAAGDAGAPVSIVVQPPDAPPRSFVGGRLDDDLSRWPRVFQWELNAPDFRHSAHAEVVTRKARELAAAIAGKQPVDVAAYTVRAPYTPKIKALTVDYCASQSIDLEAPDRERARVRVYHVHPFGACDVEAERSRQGVPFFPRHDADGELYLGLRGVEAPQSVTILCQLAEGSADPDLPAQPVTWSYLDGDRWSSLDGRVAQDTTNGLLSSGILELSLPVAAPSVRVRGGLYWIRASVARSVASVCDVIALRTQATSATFADQDNAADHFGRPLPPDTITGLTAEVPEIAAVRQPFTSRGGRPAEEGNRWATRVSERLRHRQRAISSWDYERLVLDRFPEIYKARCVPADPDAPGEVRIVVIPDVHRLAPADPFEPKAPARLLAAIESYLGERAPAFVRVRVRNPRYVAARVRMRVRFKDGCDEGYHARRLQDELNRFLSPWAYEDGCDIALGGRIYANSILDFVDRRPYVDYVAGLALFRSEDAEEFAPTAPPPDGEGEFVAAGRPDAVLVAARTHIIDVVREAVYEERLTTGIDFMAVELDFIVA